MTDLGQLRHSALKLPVMAAKQDVTRDSTSWLQCVLAARRSRRLH